MKTASADTKMGENPVFSSPQCHGEYNATEPLNRTDKPKGSLEFGGSMLSRHEAEAMAATVG